jgi:hypothetical protein
MSKTERARELRRKLQKARYAADVRARLTLYLSEVDAAEALTELTGGTGEPLGT